MSRDITLLSPNWPSFIRQITKRESVFYADYKNSENSKEVLDDMRPMYKIPRKTKVRAFTLTHILNA